MTDSLSATPTSPNDSTASQEGSGPAIAISDPTPDPLPEVRQCQDPTSHLFGCVAVASKLAHFKWGVFNPLHGGHWDMDDSSVGDWTVL